MLVLGIAIVAAALVPLVTFGSYSRLLRTKLHWGWLLALGLAIQLVLEYYTLPRQYWHSIGFGLLVASYVLILAWAGRNLLLRGMGIVFIGIACNALVIVLNQGMPVKLPAEWKNQSWTQPTVKHHPQQPGEKLLVLSDIIILKHPYDTVMSFGDLILAVGLCDVSFNAARDPRKRRKKTRPPSGRAHRAAAASRAAKAAATSPAVLALEPDVRVESNRAFYEPAAGAISRPR